MNIFFSKRLPLLLLSTALLIGLGTEASAQNKNVKKASKEQTDAKKVSKEQTKVGKEQTKEGKEQKLFSGTIYCKMMNQLNQGFNEAQAPALTRDSKAGAEKEEKAKTDMPREIVFTYDKGKSNFLYGNIQGSLDGKNDAVVMHVMNKGYIVKGEVSLCELTNTMMCSLASKYMEISNSKDPMAKRHFFETHYQRSDEVRDIAGVKCVMYQMNLQGMGFPVWVDESRTTDGMMWPYIGLTHPVLGGIFFLPVNEFELTLTEFEAYTCKEDLVESHVTSGKVKEVSPKEIEEIVRTTVKSNAR